MRRNFPLPGRRHGLGQKEAAAVARVTNAFRNIGAPDQPSSIKRVLQQQGHVKPLRAKLSRQPLAAGKPPVQAFRTVWNRWIPDSLFAIDIANEGPSTVQVSGARKRLPDARQRGRGMEGSP